MMELDQNWYSNPEWWSAIGTIAVGIVAVGIAIFQEKIKSLLTDTQLEISLIVEPPDVHKIKLNSNQGQIDSFYIRARVSNVGNYVAENVEIMIDSVCEIRGQDRVKVKRFLPMNLNWSHYGGTTMSRILPGHYRHIDIGYISFLIPKNKIGLHIDTVVQPNMVEGDMYPNILDPGVYEFELNIGSNSSTTERKKFRISFTNEFYVTEEDMFKNSLKIQELNNTSPD